MKESLVDLSVLIVFFTRQDTLQQVFNRVKEARPARLFLYQDGPREGRTDDIENIRKCREIVSHVDWDCEVHTLYQEKNYGADESGYIADRWAFSQTDKCLVLEDDVIPALSYFSFCKEMLDRYEHDERVMLISGWNLEEETKGVESDYFFSYTPFSMAWASWARVVNQWDAHHAWLEDAEKVAALENHVRQQGLNRLWLKCFRPLAAQKKVRFESSLIATLLLHRGLCIVPTRNAANNVGVNAGGVHYGGGLRMIARGERRIFTMQTYELPLGTLRHPQEVCDYPRYKQRAYRIRGINHPLVHLYRGVETTLYQLLWGNRAEAWQTFKRRLIHFLTGHFA